MHPLTSLLEVVNEMRRAGLADAPDQVQAVADHLYGVWYTGQNDEADEDPVMSWRDDLSGALRAAVPASTRWQRGWVSMAAGANGGCTAGRGEQTRQVPPGQWANISRPGSPAMPGDAVAVSECVDWNEPTRGTWHLQSATGEPYGPLTRVYWNVGAKCVGPVLSEVVRLLDELGARYTLKCPIRASGYDRTDTLVVYLGREQWSAFMRAVTDLASSLRPYLRPACPPLTRRISEGVSYAEDPGGGQSFGEHRCRVLAPAVLDLLQRRQIDSVVAIEILESALRDAGIDPEQPWLVSYE